MTARCGFCHPPTSGTDREYLDRFGHLLALRAHGDRLAERDQLPAGTPLPAWLRYAIRYTAWRMERPA